MRALLVLTLIATSSAAADEPLKIRKGNMITVDGKLSPGEWDDAQKIELPISAGWRITVRYKHDGANLLFAFDPLMPGAGSEGPVRFPELLLDPENKKSETWQAGQWWLHASATDCEGNGEFNVYRRDGKFLGAKEKPGWVANNWPLETPPVIEISVSFAKLGVKPSATTRIGFALDLTDTQHFWTYWPASAKIERPATWGEALILP